MNQKLKYVLIFLAGAATMYLALYVWVLVEAVEVFHRMTSGN